jgi:hypothetical protein
LLNSTSLPHKKLVEDSSQHKDCHKHEYLLPYVKFYCFEECAGKLEPEAGDDAVSNEWLPMIIEFQTPSPLLLFSIVPPALQDTYFAASDDYRIAVINCGWPYVFACDFIPLTT